IIPTSVLELIGGGSGWDISLGAWATDYETSFYHSEFGYSFIAEAYMNYGELGCVFTFFYGWFIAMAENLSYKKIINNKYPLACALIVFLCFQIFYARGNLMLVHTMYRYGIYLIVFCLLISKYRKLL
ncbi:MAG: O-antigen polysaccharide polymerase Wzy, partial [Bacteroidaceae bacterium]|nr:O-antigen polysaccharide polymerase Wzy [Bacteroidaceae bacterium]